MIFIVLVHLNSCFSLNFQELSFRLQSKCQLFDGSNNALLGARCSIVASASCHGIVFIGSFNPELLVVTLKDVEATHVGPDVQIPVRKVNLPSPTTNIATNCDSSILAVSLKLNGTPHIQMYSVASFLTPVNFSVGSVST